MFFRAGLHLSRCCCTTQCVPFVVKLNRVCTPLSWRFDLQGLHNIIEKQSENGGKSWSGKLKLFHRVQLEKLVVVQRVASVTDEQSMQMAEKLQS